jgi:hypothetical protein
MVINNDLNKKDQEIGLFYYVISIIQEFLGMKSIVYFLNRSYSGLNTNNGRWFHK